MTRIFEVEITTGLLKGTVELPDVGNGDPPPSNGDPLPPAAEPYYWFQDGEGLSIWVKDQVIAGRALTWVNAVYRRPFFFGAFACSSWPWQAGAIGVKVNNGVLDDQFQNGGLRSQLGGWAKFKHGSGSDFVMGDAKFDQDFVLRFGFPNPKDSNRLKAATAKDFPATYSGTYGGVIFEWGIVLP